ncbi:MCM2/3/5 family protein [Cardiosporidium cionae]|uniref:MCM2/3/5 family protein n=1 Tax=Cardiosporidium cionae TaxID=476202 RepID=A0ABQ7J4E5_9APIC|nr:MCM2/3/5 family protein [Cardiosporidium cionae]|eukprot:KAF8817934.1 MCM2/3/5 family protein [Cardiosporidium cionae]
MAFYESDIQLYEERVSPASHLMDSMMMGPTQGELRSVSGDTAATSLNSPLKNAREQILIQQQEGTRFLHERSLVFNAAVQSFKEFIEANDDAFVGIPFLKRDFLMHAHDMRGYAIQKSIQQLSEIAPKKNIRQRYIADLTQLDTIQSRLIREDPMLSLPSFERALGDYWDTLNLERDLKAEILHPAVGIVGWMGANHITPRGLTAQKLDRLVCVEGVVNKCSPVHPKLQESVYVRESTTEGEEAARSVYIRPHYDITDFDKTARDAALPPANDVEGKIQSKIEVGFCLYKDHQKFVVQECPESAPTGQMTRWVDVIVEEDLFLTSLCTLFSSIWGALSFCYIDIS